MSARIVDSVSDSFAGVPSFSMVPFQRTPAAAAPIAASCLTPTNRRSASGSGRSGASVARGGGGGGSCRDRVAAADGGTGAVGGPGAVGGLDAVGGPDGGFGATGILTGAATGGCNAAIGGVGGLGNATGAATRPFAELIGKTGEPISRCDSRESGGNVEDKSDPPGELRIRNQPLK